MGRASPSAQRQLQAGLSLLLYALTLVSCGSAPQGKSREFPLLPGGSVRSEIRRVDIDDHVDGCPLLSFEVDCRALPYAKGEERDFCYQWGSWGVVAFDEGIIVGCGCGEFGGFVLWYTKAGDLLQTLIAGDVPSTFLYDGDSLICVTGLTHLSLSEGVIHTFRLAGNRWTPVATIKLPEEADRIEVEEDGGLLFRLCGFKTHGGTCRYRAGVLDLQLWPEKQRPSREMATPAKIAAANG